ncbi:carbohydrate ABC transporter permease [Vibrio sp. Y2-5]|uniref:carbohydrate ABC transporter permease n=1 Tax=Vibrio TaxID=662 RepID=UPI00142D6E6A|nr:MULTISPECIES: carbohydrate ABC transporter permease [Vibrio]MBD0787313.1 carbohydrate ABC transporter permease [Vibrio sp. Y2-5]NIY93732.1 carbohydrate ABC transporter permease [Vibrio diazotrophicus]
MKSMGKDKLIAYITVFIGAIIMLAPFYFMFIFSSHSNTGILSVPPPITFGDYLVTNFNTLIDYLPYFWHNLALSLFIAIVVTALNLLFCSLAGYAFSMFEFRFKNALFVMIMGTMLIPPFLGMIPTAMVMSQLGWMNDPKALIVPAACGAMGIFMMRQFISSSIPKELVEAARMDGCREFKIYYRIIVPLILPAFGTLGLITFIGTWNNFMGPLVVMNDMKMFTVPLALRALQGTGQVPWGAVSIGASIAVLPLLFLFVIASRRLIDGLTSGAVKG